MTTKLAVGNLSTTAMKSDEIEIIANFYDCKAQELWLKPYRA